MRHHPLHRAILVLASLALGSLAACGGGGEGATTAQPSNALMPVVATSSSTAAAAIPVAEFDSGVDSQPPGQALALPDASATTSGIVVAVDSKGNIVAGALVPPGTTGSFSLTAETTAVTLVRIAIGPLPSGVTETALGNEIQAVAEYPNLVALIAAAASNGTSAAASDEVLTSVASATIQVLAVMAGVATPASLATPAAKIQSVNPATLPQVTQSPPPFPLFPSSSSA